MSTETTQLPDEWQDKPRNPRAQQLGYPDVSVSVFQEKNGNEIVFMSDETKITTDRETTVSIETRR